MERPFITWRYILLHCLLYCHNAPGGDTLEFEKYALTAYYKWEFLWVVVQLIRNLAFSDFEGDNYLVPWLNFMYCGVASKIRRDPRGITIFV